MKRLSILLFFISSISYSQILSFDDIKLIDSKNIYEKTMIESGFIYENEMNGFITYSYPQNTEWEIKTFYIISKRYFYFQFIFGKVYDLIFDDVKDNCSYYGIMKSANGKSRSCYSCPGSKYPGKLCFGNRAIENLTPEN